MIGFVHDFENLTLTSFPIIFELLELWTSELLQLSDRVDLIVEFCWSFSVNEIH